MLWAFSEPMPRIGQPVTASLSPSFRSPPSGLGKTPRASGNRKPIGTACFGPIAEFAASLRKGAHIHVTGYLRSREVERPVDGKSKKNSATAKVQVWEIRAVRIAKLDRAVEVNPSTDIPADDPAF
jgi:hypothetical protein